MNSIDILLEDSLEIQKHLGIVINSLISGVGFDLDSDNVQMHCKLYSNTGVLLITPTPDLGQYIIGIIVPVKTIINLPAGEINSFMSIKGWSTPHGFYFYLNGEKSFFRLSKAEKYLDSDLNYVIAVTNLGLVPIRRIN